MRRHILFIITILFIGWGTVTPAHAEIITITTCDFESLQSAVATDAVGKIILFDCAGTIVFTRELVISQDVILIGGGEGDVIFDGNRARGFFFINENRSLVLDGFTIQNGHSRDDGVIIADWDSRLSIANSTFLNNSANFVNAALSSRGSGIYNRGTMTIHNSTFSGCECVDGTIFNGGGQVTITQSTFSDNLNGAIWNTNSFRWEVPDGNGGTRVIDETSIGQMTISDSTFTHNSNHFGGIIRNDGHLSISTSTFTDNSATTHGATIINSDRGQLTITDSTFANNSASNGGAINNGSLVRDGGYLTITNTVFRGNSATEQGGALYNTGNNVSITRSTFADNVATMGQGAIFSDGIITSQESHYENNTCGGYGVFITFLGYPNTAENATGCPPDVIKMETTVTDCENFTGDGTISQAVATANLTHEPISFACSGTVVFTGALSITGHVTIIGGGDIVFDGGGRQGFFSTASPPMPDTNAQIISSSLLLDGLTLQNGGGISNSQIGTLTLNNITFTGNAGGIMNAGALVITNSTFSGNSGDRAGLMNYGTAIVTDSTFSDNVTSSASNGNAITNHEWMSIQNSHFENNTCVGVGAGILVNNGGNTSNNAYGCPSDTPLTTVVSDCVNFKGVGTLYEAVAVANVTHEPITFACEGVINFSEVIIIHGAVTIIGGGNITFDGGERWAFFNLHEGASLTLNDLTLLNADSDGNDWGVIDNDGGSLTLNTITMRGGAIRMARAMLYNAGTLTISNSTFTFTDNSRAIIHNEGTLTVTNSTFSDNVWSFYGTAVWNERLATAHITQSTFSNNAGKDSGSVVNFGNLTISNSTFSDNLSTEDSGAIDNHGTLIITHSTFTGNSAIPSNTGHLRGGAITNNQTLIISNSTFTDNISENCGAIGSRNGVTISNSTFTNNSATENGGAICNFSNSSRLTISNSTFTGNSATVGGAISNQSTNEYRTNRITITASTFVDNVATTGDAIFSDDYVLSQDTHYANNDCVFEGIFTDGGGNTTDNADGCASLP